MSEGKVSSVRWKGENWEYIQEMDIAPSRWANEKMAEERRTAGLTRRDRLERELGELREERQRKERLANELADKEAEIERKLKEYENNIEQEVEDAIKGLDWITRVHPDLRTDKEQMRAVIKNTGLRHSLLVDLCESVDIHYGELLGECYTVLTEEMGVPYEDIYSHPLYDESAGEELTSEEEGQVRAFLREQL